MESRRRKQTEEPPVEEWADDLVRDEVDGDLQDEDIEEGKRAHDDDDDDSLGRPVRLNR
jgi:hypothetical protein